jgi:hypothetical protein
MSTRNITAGNARQTRKADYLIVICDLTVQKMWDPRRLTTLQAYTACYGDSFIDISERAVPSLFPPMSTPSTPDNSESGNLYLSHSRQLLSTCQIKDGANSAMLQCRIASAHTALC